MDQPRPILFRFAEALLIRGLLDAEALLTAWRRFEESGGDALYPRDFAAYLAHYGYLTRDLQKRLIGELEQEWEHAAALLERAHRRMAEEASLEPRQALAQLDQWRAAQRELAEWFSDTGLTQWASFVSVRAKDIAEMTTAFLDEPDSFAEPPVVADPFAGSDVEIDLDDDIEAVAEPMPMPVQPATDFVATHAESLFELPSNPQTHDASQGPLEQPSSAPPHRSAGSSQPLQGSPVPPPPPSGVSSKAGIPTKMGFDNLVMLDGVKAKGHERLGRYAVLGRIGKGGMGEVIQARDTDLNRSIALKLLLAGSGARSIQVEKFLIEAQVTGQLEHPNIVPVHELGTTDDNRVYFTMKHVRGESLQAILKELRLRADPKRQGKNPKIPSYTLTDLLEMFLKICDGVAFAHSKGVVHRDLKPENVMVGEYGEVLVMDWGLAKVRGIEEDWSASAVKIDLKEGSISSQVRGNSQADVVKTMDGTILGTPAFMPPEQARGEVENIDHRSDIYSLGAILYQILTLKVPFTGKSPYETLVRVIQGEFEPPAKATPERKIPPELDALVLKAMALDKKKRYQNVSELQADVRAFIEGHAVSAVNYSPAALAWKWVKRNKGRVVGTAAAILVALVSVGVVLGLQWQREAASLAERENEIKERLAEAEGWLAHAESLRERADDAFAEAELLVATAAGEPDFVAADRIYDEALAKYDEAATGFEQVLWLDETNRDAIEGKSRATSRQEALQALLEERRDEIRRAQQLVTLQREAREDGEALRVRAVDALERANSRYEQARVLLYTSGLTSDGEAHREPDFGLFDGAAELIAQARARDPHSEAIQETNTVIATRRTAARTQWRRELELARRNQLAEHHHERGLTALRAGQERLAEPPDSPEARDAANAQAFGNFTQALRDLDRAMEGFAQLGVALADAEDASREMTEAVEQRRERAQADKVHALLALGRLALRNREFTIVQAWLNQTEGLIEEREDLAEAVAQLRADLAEEMTSAEQFVAALERAREAAAAERFAAALEQYALALGIADTRELREEIRGVRFSAQLHEGDGYREARNWQLALEVYEGARQVATTPAHDEEIARRISSLREEAGRVLLAEARSKLDDPSAAATAEARELLDELLQVARGTRFAEQAQLLQDELTARDFTPEGYVYVSGGEVMLGSTVQSERNPPRRLTLESFYMAVHQVTVGEYRDFIEAGGYEAREHWSETGWRWLQELDEQQRKPLDWENQLSSTSHPVVGVSAHEAEAYAAWLTTTAEPLGDQRPAFRLPSEAEWEMVARHTPNERLASGRRFPWGNEFAHGGFHSGETRGRLRPVGSHTEDESAFRIRDLAGNASEWVRLIRGEEDDADLFDEAGAFATRGGSNLMPGWQLERFASVTKRGFIDGPDSREPDLGFRLVRNLPGR